MRDTFLTRISSVFFSIVMLAACNDSDMKTSLEPGVYSGVTHDAEGDTISVEATILNSSNILVSIWDEREHQQTTQGNFNTQDGSFSFGADTYECKQGAQYLSCYSAHSSFQLPFLLLENEDTKNYAGTYNAIIDDDISQLIIEPDGTATISAQNCPSQGKLITSHNINGLMTLMINRAECNFPNIDAVVRLKIDNQSLFSIEAQSVGEFFPQVWVRQ